jgi:hypothetical protein
MNAAGAMTQATRTDADHRFEAAAFAAPAAVDRLQSRALIAGGAGLLVCIVGGFLSPDYFFRSWLVGWVYWVGISVGSLAIMMLHHMTRGAWGLVVRRVLEAAARTLPILLVLAVPLLFGMPRIYLWARKEVVDHDALLTAKKAYLNVPFWGVRLVIFFALWSFFAFVLSRLSWRQDAQADPGLTRRMQLIAGPGIVLYGLTVTLASVDWLMSIEPHWYSTIYGVYLIGSQGLSALAFLIMFALWLSRRPPMDGVIKPSHFHDWGKLFLAFTMLWAYFNFSQFLIIWSGNQPEEITWYLHRIRGGWGFIALALVVFHFALPFALLLSRDLKRSASRLVWVAILMAVMRLVDLFWQVEPGYVGTTGGETGTQNPAFYWMYLAAPVAIGGFWLWWFLRELKSRPLVPINDPYLAEAIAHE